MKITIEGANLSPNQIKRINLDMEYFFKVNFQIRIKGDGFILEDT